MRWIGASTLLAILLLGAGAPAGDRETEMRISANEVAAIASLRNLSSAQAQFQAAACADEDNDGTGEFGTLAELSAAVPVRGTKRVIAPPVLSKAWQRVGADGTVRRNGYVYAVWLPMKGGEPAGAPAAGAVEPDLAETTYVAYAWPEKQGETGRRTFVLTTAGDVLACAAAYDDANRPLPHAALRADTGDDLVVGKLAAGARGADGRTWHPIEDYPLVVRDRPVNPLARAEAARLAANETAARATLRNIVAAQAHIHISALVDEDDDGTGEFGTFAEMAGRLPPRGSKRVIQPPLLSEAFLRIDEDGLFLRSGYLIRIWLPAAGGKGVHETKDNIPAGKVVPDLAETRFVVYAWPERTGVTGHHTFAVDSSGTVVCCVTKDYSGAAGPRPGAALVPKPTPTRIDRPLVESGKRAADGWVWTLVD
jgi:hypothetical protein